MIEIPRLSLYMFGLAFALSLAGVVAQASIEDSPTDVPPVQPLTEGEIETLRARYAPCAVSSVEGRAETLDELRARFAPCVAAGDR